jgi:hypothetical protein
MSRRIYLVALLVGCMPGCSRSEPGGSTSAASNGTVQSIEELVIGEQFSYDNLTIFPVTSKMTRSSDAYTTLDQGLKDGTVEVHEMGSSAIRTAAADANPEPTPTRESGNAQDANDQPATTAQSVTNQVNQQPSPGNNADGAQQL